MSEEHIMGTQCLSVYLSPFAWEISNPMTRGNCWNTLLQQCESGPFLLIVATMTSDSIIAIMAWIPLLHFIFPWLPCWRQRSWCGVKNIFVGISVYTKEYIFSILLFLATAVRIETGSSENGQCPTKYSYNKSTIVTNLQRICFVLLLCWVVLSECTINF
jgi:hypothetical protein